MSLNRTIVGCMAIVACWLGAWSYDTPSITMHTENYDLQGEENALTLALGSNVAGTIGVNCGFGIVEYDIEPARFDQTQGGMQCTYIPCVVSSAGNISVYCPEGLAIDYFDGDGCGLTSINFNQPEEIKVLTLRHNSLKALDLTDMRNVSSIDVGDNPFTDSPLIIGPDKPNLIILSIDIIDNMDASFSLTDYPALRSLDAMNNKSLYVCDPSQCPYLLKLSIDETPVSSIDVSHNQELIILNVSGTNIASIDVSNNIKLQQLYVNHVGGNRPISERLSHLDVSKCPDLIYLFCSYNALVDIDVTHNPLLRDLYVSNNFLTEINLDNNPDLINVGLGNNYFDFATLPADRDWLDYTYYQRPMQVPKSYLLGTALDLSARVLRPGSETTATLYGVDPMDSSRSYEVDPAAYTYEKGIVTIIKMIEDSVYVSFSNSSLPLYAIQTSRFKVKDAEHFGQKDLVMELTVPLMDVGDLFECRIGMAGASEHSPKNFYVDLGDGTLIAAEATAELLPATPNFSHVKGAHGVVKIYVDEGELLTAFGFANETISSIDLTKLPDLRELSLCNTHLYDLNLRMNRKLERLVLTGNHFSESFTLEGENGGYTKNFLTYLDLSNNELQSVELNMIEAIRHLDLSRNALTRINLADGEAMEYLDLSYNNLDFLRLSYQSSLTTLNASHNVLEQIIMPETNVIQTMDISSNRLTFVTLPHAEGLDAAHYQYSPQADISISSQGRGCDLSEQYVLIDGFYTQYAWYNDNGDKLSEDVDYEISQGVTKFLAPSEGQTLHCEITNAGLPNLILCTTPIVSSGQPQYVIGEFTTTRGGQNVTLSLGAAHEGSSIYIDWTGDGDMAQYLLKPTYTLYNAVTKANARVKVYSYDQDCDLTIFSVTGATMSDVDLSGMKQLKCLSLNSAGIDALAMPESANLQELTLNYNKFDNFDFALYPNLRYISFEHNKFASIDLTMLPSLEALVLSHNDLTEIKFDNPNLWSVSLSNNKFEEIDFSGVPSLYQVILDGNKLQEIDLDDLSQLHVVYLNNNAFTFQTLPLPRSQWSVYYYGNQAQIEAEHNDGIVDLSSQYMVGDVESEYLWVEGEPWFDSETGAMMGYALVEGEDYVVNQGVTMFLRDIDDVVGIITNATFPMTYMRTQLMNVVASGLNDIFGDEMSIVVHGRSIEVAASPKSGVTVCDMRGVVVASGRCDDSGLLTIDRLPVGVFIVNANGMVARILIK